MFIQIYMLYASCFSGSTFEASTVFSVTRTLRPLQFMLRRMQCALSAVPVSFSVCSDICMTVLFRTHSVRRHTQNNAHVDFCALLSFVASLHLCCTYIRSLGLPYLLRNCFAQFCFYPSHATP